MPESAKLDPAPAPVHPLKSVYVWMLIAIPLSSVIMGGVLLWLAISSFSGMVADDYYERGLQINQDLSRDQAARDVRIHGRLRTGVDATRMTVQGAAAFQEPATVTLSFSHATRAGLDRVLELRREGAGHYRGSGVKLAPGRWYIQASAGNWRITGSIQAVMGGGPMSTTLGASGPGP